MGKYRPIVGTLGYVLSKDKKKVLMMHRNKRKDDDHIGKYNGLGGKMHEDEDIATAMAREIYEEAGIVPEKMTLKGTMNWTGFGKNSEDWLGFIFLIEEYSGTPKKTCPEGDLEWIEIEKIYDLPLWESDEYFLPHVFGDTKEPFHGYSPHHSEKMISFSLYPTS
ncbi:8-oxo-dGTP diphosphatase [bacterium]|nr:8-oxo-dGTP diphosphatase [bacterium]